MKTLESLAISKAIEDRSWLEKDMFFKLLTNDIRNKFIQECLDQKNIAAFQEFLLNLRQEKLAIPHNPGFTDEFALVVANCIKDTSRWKETYIKVIDLRGCKIGPLATKKFCDIAVEHQKKAKEANKRILPGFIRDLLPNQNWFHSKVNITKLCLNFHVKRNTFEDVCDALQSASSILQPYAIQAEALGRQRVCQLLDILAVEELPLYELDLYMNSLGQDGVVDVCNRLCNFKDMLRLNFAYAMISEEDRQAAVAIAGCISEMPLLQTLILTANILGNNFSLIFNRLPVKSIRKLDLSYCGMPSAVISALAEKLKSSGIMSLSLAFNPLKRNDEFDSLLLILTNCKKSLRRLDISNTGLTYDNTMKLVQFFRDNREDIRLEWLGIENKDIRDDDLIKEELRLALPKTQIKWE